MAFKRDFVWTRFKERFFVDVFEKLKPKADSSIKFVNRINDNAYKIDLSCEYKISTTFNVVDLSPHYKNLETPMDEGDASPTRTK